MTISQGGARVKPLSSFLYRSLAGYVVFKTSKMRSILTVFAVLSISPVLPRQSADSGQLGWLERAAASNSTDPRLWYALGRSAAAPAALLPERSLEEHQERNSFFVT
jgi:hypothetical protein